MVKSFIENEVISLGEFTKEDLEFFKNFTPYRDVLLTDYNLCFLDNFEFKRWLRNIYNRKNKYFSIRLKSEENRLIGYIAVKKNNSFRGYFELSISFDAKYSSKGYGFNSLKLFLEYYFKNFDNTIFLNVNSFNKRAISLYEKIGFEKISEFYGEFEVQNFKDTNAYKLNKDEFMLKHNMVYTKVYSMKLDEYRFIERWG